ncbi:MAG: DnaB-like helicase N-terminal domain-containing protein, partial [Terriglobales bacterium]
MATADLNLERGMPASLDAERSTLGAILLDNDIFPQAAESIKADDFSLDSHRRIYARMMELNETGRPIDLVTLSEELARKKELESVGGVTYLSTLTEGLPRRDNIEHYVKIV